MKAHVIRDWYADHGFPHAAAAVQAILWEHDGDAEALMGRIRQAEQLLPRFPLKLWPAHEKSAAAALKTKPAR